VEAGTAGVAKLQDATIGRHSGTGCRLVRVHLGEPPGFEGSPARDDSLGLTGLMSPLERHRRRTLERSRPPTAEEREIGTGGRQGKDDNEEAYPSASGASLRDHSHILSIHLIE
jgi:hypothetical protein